MPEYHGIRLVMTCEYCPEQYDAYLGDKIVGYLRLREGFFRVDCPMHSAFGGATIFIALPNGDGWFVDTEREHYLNAACLAIKEHLAKATNA